MSSTASALPPAPGSVRRVIARHSFCTLATSSADRPHSVGVLYSLVGTDLFVSTLKDSKKARNIASNQRVAVCIPVRRFPMAPPFLVQFGAAAEIVACEDSVVVDLVRDGRLKKITGHGELDEPGTCFLRITPDEKVFTYGIGVPLRTLLRDPTHANRTFRFVR
jgi:nitroimidazol reductase NimA-like FMN-containing flavoprotein (pyridoxamine 5'-phosphate oxidase superfamily)